MVSRQRSTFSFVRWTPSDDVLCLYLKTCITKLRLVIVLCAPSKLENTQFRYSRNTTFESTHRETECVGYNFLIWLTCFRVLKFACPQQSKSAMFLCVKDNICMSTAVNKRHVFVCSNNICMSTAVVNRNLFKSTRLWVHERQEDVESTTFWNFKAFDCQCCSAGRL